MTAPKTRPADHKPGAFSMPGDEYDFQWRCSVCHTWHPVPSLARACEHRHESEVSDGGSHTSGR